MHSIPFEIPPPKNEADFERMCAQVYGVVFNDRMPKMNGRRGQVQGGVDVFVKEPNVGRVGIQCKKYTAKPVTWADVEDEVGKADKHQTGIQRLILATTAPNDAVLLKKVQALSDAREAEELFSVEVEFWDDICNHIDRFPVLQDSYAPHTPGAAFHRQEASLSALGTIALDTNDVVHRLASLPPARPDSVDRIITAQLDHTNELIKASRYRDALDHLAAIGKDLAPFDLHQKARWYLQKGLSLWFMRVDDNECAGLFLKAFDYYPDDERMAAAQVRGLMLQRKLEAARAAGEASLERFPDSQQVWFALANVRLMQGSPFQKDDVPEALKHEPDALQFAAQTELEAGNLDEAIRLSQEAALHPEAGYFARANALWIAAECGSRLPVAAMTGALPTRESSALEFALRLFDPLHERLWNVQSDSVSTAATHLAYALIMLHRFPEALALARDAEARGYRSGEILRSQLVALYELGRQGELVRIARDRMTDMNPACFAIVGQAAAQEGDIAILEQASDAAQASSDIEDETIELLAALRWEALMRAGRRETAIHEVLSAKVDISGGLVSACIAARVLTRAGLPLDADAVVQRAKSLVTSKSSDGEKLMLAELLLNLGHYVEAGTLLEPLVTVGKLSELHNRLLACYIRSKNRRKAKELIAKLPANWMESDETLNLAIELGQEATDWNFLRPLVDAQLRKHPNSSGSWLAKLSISLHGSAPSEFQSDLRNAPEFLEGPIQATTQLAGLELRYGEAERGMRRLYRMLRCNLDEPEALSAYFISIYAAPSELPLMEQEMSAVRAGTCVELVDDFGKSTRLVIDPEKLGELPKREGYSGTTESVAAALLGTVVGQKVDLPTLSFGDSKQYTVTAIRSAYFHMLEVVRERANAIGGLPNIKMVHIGTTGDAEHDLAYMKAEVMRSSNISRQLFDSYAVGHMTLSGFAERKGRSPIEAVLGWPVDGPPIFVGAGSEAERISALELLARPDASYVIDALTLAEFVNLEIQQVLAHLPKLLVTTLTKAMLERQLREAQQDRSVATSMEVDGELTLIEHDANYHERRIDFFKTLLAVVEAYCEVHPAYGELEDDPNLRRLTNVLQAEEMEMLLLAKANKATILTLDGRLRLALSTFAKVKGVWPQALILHCANSNLMAHRKLSAATVRQFSLNRSFVSLNAIDLTWMILQGDYYLQQGMSRFKAYLSSETTDFGSVMRVALEFLKQISSLKIHLGAFGELFEHIVEAAMRHKKCPVDFERIVVNFIVDLTNTASPKFLYEPANALLADRTKRQQRYLAERFKNARAYSDGLNTNRPIAVRVLFCSTPPWLIEDEQRKRPA